jgi:putative FmdB family regulatory protein
VPAIAVEIQLAVSERLRTNGQRRFLRESMPLYEYECKKCHHRFERIQKFSDRHLKKCPDCGGPVEQMISAPAVQFKGTGWYVTDYPKKSSRDSSRNGDSGDKSTSKDEKSKDDKSKTGAKSETSKSDSSKSDTSHRKSEKK